MTSQKEALITFLQNKTTTFTIQEMQSVIAIISNLEEKKETVGEGLDKRAKKEIPDKK